MCESKGAYQLHGKLTLISAFVFSTYVDSTIPHLKSKNLAIFLGYTTYFLSDLVRNPEDRFSHDTAQNYNALCYFVLEIYVKFLLFIDI